MGVPFDTGQNNKKTGSMNSLLGAGIGAAGSLIGMIGQRGRENRTNKQQEKLMGIQQKNQMALNEQGRDLSMDIWNKTGYEGQMKQMKAAGVDPALMYGSAGSGGSTTGMSGGSAASGSAAQPQQMMDIGAGALDGLMKKAQIDNMNADSEKKRVEAEKLGGVDTREGESRIKEIDGKVQLNLTQEALNKSAESLNKKQEEVADSVMKLNDSLVGLNSQKVKESIANTSLTQSDLDWQEKSGINRNDPMVGKTLKYLSNTTGMSQNEILILVGGYTALKDVVGMIPNLGKLFKNMPSGAGVGTGAPVKGFGK